MKASFRFSRTQGVILKEMNKPLISIIIPVYNAEDSIKEIASSVLSEDLDNIEMILVDDGSTDSTLKALRGIKSNRKNVTVISQKNGGPSSARNAGIKKAKGEYIQFFDADDNITPKALKTIVKTVEKTKPDVLVSGWSVDLEKDDKLIVGYKKIRPTKETVKADNIVRYTIRSIGTDGKLYNLWNKLFRADIIHENNLKFREDLRFGEDLVFSLEYFKHMSGNLVVIPDITYRYRSSSKVGVFSKSSLMPEYRHANNEALEEFVGKNRDPELDDWFYWVKWRWLLSYWKFVVASSLEYKEKLRLIKEVARGDYVTTSSSKNIGFTKFLMEHIGNILRLSPFLAHLAIVCVVVAKNMIIKIRSLFMN